MSNLTHGGWQGSYTGPPIDDLDAELRELREKLDARRAEMRSIVDGAEAEKRDVSRRETARLVAIESDMIALEAKIEEVEERQADDRQSRRQVRDTEFSRERRGDGIGRILTGTEYQALAEGSGSGSVLVPPEYLPRVWDRLAAASVGLASGFRVMETERDELHLPHTTADNTVAWTAEAAGITPSDPTTEDVVATPRKLAGLQQLSNELIASEVARHLKGEVAEEFARVMSLTPTSQAARAKAAALDGWLRGAVAASTMQMKLEAEAAAYARERVRAERPVGFKSAD
jgi:HK97 family phage major capsid protein